MSDHVPGPRIGSLCTGYGGLDLAVELVLGGQLLWYAETDRHARTVCAHHWPHVPNLGDIRTIDWARVPPVDVLTAGFPCQDISNAGKRAGITGPHSSLWHHITTALRVLRPPHVFVENVAALRRRGLDVPGQRGSHGDLTLPSAALRCATPALPTPRTSDARGPGHHGDGGPDLRTTVAQLTTSSLGTPDQATWGIYAPAIARWELLISRPVPAPTQPGQHGKPVLAPPFVEWLMGLPAHWVTDPTLNLPRTGALRVLGNGVVPAQAATALRLLLCRHR